MNNNNNHKNNSYIPPISSNNLYPPKPTFNKGKKKNNFKAIKHNTISSLNDVEYFLNKLHYAIRYIKLYKLLK